MQTQRDGDSAASAPEPRWRPSGHRQGFVTIVGGRACSWRWFDCSSGVGASAPASRRQFHVATTGASAPDCAVCSVTWGSASADRSITALKPLLRTPVPRPTGRTPGHRHGADGALRSTAHHVPPGTGSTALFGRREAPFHRGTANGALRGTARTASPGQGTASLRRRGTPLHPGHGRRHSSERREHGLTETGNHISSEARHPISPETGNHISSEARHPTSNRPESSSCRQGTPAPGARHTALFGAPRARPRRSPATGAPRSTARQAPSGQGTRRPSGHRAPHPTGTGQTALFGAPRAPPRRDREPALFGGPAPHLTGSGPCYGMGTPPTGAGQTALFGAPPASPRRDRDPELFGARVTDPTGAGNPDLLGGSAHPPRLGQGPPASPRQPAPFGASRARTRDWDPGPPRRPGLPISRATGHPAPRGRATGDLRAGINGLYATRLGGLAVGNGHRPRSATSAGQDGNDRRATAAVMRYGCWRGEIFKGCEPRRGDSRPSDRVTFGWHVKAEREKRGEPLTGCGVQQTRDLHAE